MFELTQEEYNALRSQIVTLETESTLTGKHSKYSAYAFTEQGIAMLSSVLKSKTAIQVNISIMRAFVILRNNLVDIEELRDMFEELERKVDLKFDDVYRVLNFLASPAGQRKVIKGFTK